MGRPRKSSTSKVQIKEKSTVDTKQEIKEESKAVANTSPRITHTVQWGESIQSIAGMYSVPVMKLIKLNGTDKVSVGRTIYIN